MSIEFTKTDIAGFRERKEGIFVPEKLNQKISAIKETKLYFFSKSEKIKNRAIEIVNLAKGIIDKTEGSLNKTTEKYKQELKDKIKEITHHVYKDEYMFDRERDTIVSVFNSYLGMITDESRNISRQQASNKLTSLQQQYAQKKQASSATREKSLIDLKLTQYGKLDELTNLFPDTSDLNDPCIERALAIQTRLKELKHSMSLAMLNMQYDSGHSGLGYADVEENSDPYGYNRDLEQVNSLKTKLKDIFLKNKNLETFCRLYQEINHLTAQIEESTNFPRRTASELSLEGQLQSLEYRLRTPVK